MENLRAKTYIAGSKQRGHADGDEDDAHDCEG